MKLKLLIKTIFSIISVKTVSQEASSHHQNSYLKKQAIPGLSVKAHNDKVSSSSLKESKLESHSSLLLNSDIKTLVRVIKAIDMVFNATKILPVHLMYYIPFFKAFYIADEMFIEFNKPILEKFWESLKPIEPKSTTKQDTLLAKQSIITIKGPKLKPIEPNPKTQKGFSLAKQAIIKIQETKRAAMEAKIKAKIDAMFIVNLEKLRLVLPSTVTDELSTFEKRMFLLTLFTYLTDFTTHCIDKCIDGLSAIDMETKEIKDFGLFKEQELKKLEEPVIADIKRLMNKSTIRLLQEEKIRKSKDLLRQLKNSRFERRFLNLFSGDIQNPVEKETIQDLLKNSISAFSSLSRKQEVLGQINAFLNEKRQVTAKSTRSDKKSYSSVYLFFKDYLDIDSPLFDRTQEKEYLKMILLSFCISPNPRKFYARPDKIHAINEKIGILFQMEDDAIPEEIRNLIEELVTLLNYFKDFHSKFEMQKCSKTPGKSCGKEVPFCDNCIAGLYSKLLSDSSAQVNSAKLASIIENNSFLKEIDFDYLPDFLKKDVKFIVEKFEKAPYLPIQIFFINKMIRVEKKEVPSDGSEAKEVYNFAKFFFRSCLENKPYFTSHMKIDENYPKTIAFIKYLEEKAIMVNLIKEEAGRIESIKDFEKLIANRILEFMSIPSNQLSSLLPPDDLTVPSVPLNGNLNKSLPLKKRKSVTCEPVESDRKLNKSLPLKKRWKYK
ncbi:hypothetical protein GINT2_001608 [Glugoides intestinalis]